MTQRDPTLIPPGTTPSRDTVDKEEWFERKVGEFTLQMKLPCFHDAATDEWFVDYAHWTKWEDELVMYFIHNGYRGPEIDAFIKNHALAGG